MTTNTEDSRKSKVRWFLLVGLCVGLMVGVVLGVELYQTVSNRLGYWRGTVEATRIIILSLKYQVQASDKIKTSIELGNVDDHAISFNCTLFYKAAANQDLATYSFNATINAGQAFSKSFLVQPVNVTRWVGTDTSIYEY